MHNLMMVGDSSNGSSGFHRRISKLEKPPLTRSYCTLFDKNYLYQGLALYRSLLRHGGNFSLYALCMDPTSYSMLTKMDLPGLVPLNVEELVTQEVAEVRGRTTHGQFCWVCQPLICEFVLDRFDVDMVTYLEADSLFFSDPEVLFDELGAGSVSLVPHNYSSEFDNSAAAGMFCVQFNAFRNDPVARKVLAHWRESCFKYDKAAPTKYPGQTTLDDWPERFPNVCVIRHAGAGVAPWNIRDYRLEVLSSGPHVNGLPVVFFHYHQYGRYKNGAHELGSYPLQKAVIDCFYAPYVNELRGAEAQVRAVDGKFAYRREYMDIPSFRDSIVSMSGSAIARYCEALKRKIRRRFNVYPDHYFS